MGWSSAFFPFPPSARPREDPSDRQRPSPSNRPHTGPPSKWFSLPRFGSGGRSPSSVGKGRTAYSNLYRLTGNFRQGVVFVHQPAGDRARLARADDAPVNLHDRNQFRAGTGQKTLVRIEYIVARQVRLGDAQTLLARQLHHHA